MVDKGLAPSNRYLLTSKVRGISFKITDRFYPSNDHIVKRFKRDIDEKCTFCSVNTETVTPLFWHGPTVKSLWSDVCNFIVNNIEKEFNLFWRDVWTLTEMRQNPMKHLILISSYFSV